MTFRTLSSTAFLLLVLLIPSILGAQENDDQFPIPFGPNNLGTEFYFAMPANWELPESATSYIRMYVTSPVRTRVMVWAGGNLKSTFHTTPNDIRSVDFTAIEAQMFVRTDQPPVPDDQIYPKRAIHIKADDPVVVYMMNRTSYTSDGLLLLPVSALGRKYIVASYSAVIGGTQELPSQYMIAAPYDSTEITINHPKRTPNHAAGETFTVTLNKGDVFSAMTVGYGGDMSGVTIRASKPVAVTAGQNCTYIPNQLNYCCCDHLTEMMLPTDSWGKDYLAVPFSTRLKGDFYRVFARESNTKVYVNGVEYAMLSGEGGEEGMGWLEYRALGKELVQFGSNKRISVFQYNTSQYYDNISSDPFYLALTPPEQFAREIFFCTPSADFPQNFLNVVCRKDDLDSLKITEAGQDNWRPVTQLPGMGGVNEFPEKINGKEYVGFSVEIPPGVYRLKSHDEFAAYIYGFSSYDSYGYPTAAFTSNLGVDAPAPPEIAAVVAPCSGDVIVVATSKSQMGQDVAPLSAVSLVPTVSENFQIDSVEFESGISTEARIIMSPIDRANDAVAVLAVADVAGRVIFDTIRYDAAAQSTFDVQAADVVFNAAAPGVTLKQTVTLQNNGAAPVMITSLELAKGNAGFMLEAPALPVMLDAAGRSGSSLDIDITFTPDAKGSFSDAIVVRESCDRTYLIPVAGEGTDVVLSVPDEGIAGMAGALHVAPNPATGNESAITFTMASRGAVTATIVDAAGKEVRTVAERTMMDAGGQSLKLDLTGLPAGSYLVRITTGGRTTSTSMVVVR